MKQPSVTLIGMGPRGLSILERIAAYARHTGMCLRINLIEPHACGPGVHQPRQPQYLLVNTVASQLSIFPARDSVALAPAFPTPSFTEWAREQGFRRFGEQFFETETGCGSALTDSDYLPRQLLGQYLAWAYAQIVASLPPTVTLQHLRQRAIDLFEQPDGSFVVELENGFSVPSDYLFLATGHSRNNLSDEEAWWRKFAQDHARYNSKLGFVRHAYPLDKLTAIAADATVAIQGLGLTAHDVIAELTLGRGGRYLRQGASLRYLRGGSEPRLLLFSRNCLPAAARGVNQKGIAGRHKPRFFTREAVRALREQAQHQRGSAQLDFDRELLPLLLREMGFAWRAVHDGVAPGADYELGKEEGAAIERLLYPLRGVQFADAADFARFFEQLLVEDLHEARRGNLTSPIKAAADVLRDVRAVLQEAVEHAGLTPASHRKFLSVLNPAINRVTFGPPRLRNEQLLALMEAGVLAVAAGPNPVIRIDEERSQFALYSKFASSTVIEHVDTLVVARLDAFSPETDDTVLMRNLLKRGAVRPFYNGNFHPGGLDIDRGNHPIARNGRASRRLWAVGYVAEGAHYYTHALPRPQSASRQAQDAERCVGELFAALASLRGAPRMSPNLSATATL